MERLDEERIELLRLWGEGLARDGREEMRAAGRAIVLLIEELERLQAELSYEPAPRTTPATPSDELEPDVQAGLRSRLRQFGRRQPETTST